MIKLDNLSKKYKSNIFLKEEYDGATNSWKDRIAPYVVEECKKAGKNKIVIVSSGNHALAILHESSKFNIDCKVLTYVDTSKEQIDAIKKYTEDIEYFANTEDAYVALNNYEKNGYFNASIDFKDRVSRDLPGSEGYKNIAYEIFNELNFIPDFILIPTCYGDGALGIWRGFEEIGNKLPKLILIRANEDDGDIAFSISTNKTTPQVEKLLKLGNKDIFLTDADFLNGIKVAKDLKLKNMPEVCSAGIYSALDKIKIYEKFNVVLLSTAKEK